MRVLNPMWRSFYERFGVHIYSTYIRAYCIFFPPLLLFLSFFLLYVFVFTTHWISAPGITARKTARASFTELENNTAFPSFSFPFLFLCFL